MPEYDVDELVRALFERSQRKAKNPSRAIAYPQSVYDELPIAINAQDHPVIASPQWGARILSNEIEEHFINDTGANYDLSTHVTSTWTALEGELDVDVADVVIRNSSSHSRYSISVGIADMRVSAVVANTHDWTRAGIYARVYDHSNYWSWTALAGGDYILQKVVSGSGTTLVSGIQSTAIGDEISLTCIGNTVIVGVNGTDIAAVEDSALNTQTKAGMLIANDVTTRIQEFHAWSVAGTSLDFNADPGHSFWGGPETYT